MHDFILNYELRVDEVYLNVLFEYVLWRIHVSCLEMTDVS